MFISRKRVSGHPQRAPWACSLSLQPVSLVAALIFGHRGGVRAQVRHCTGSADCFGSLQGRSLQGESRATSSQPDESGPPQYSCHFCFCRRCQRRLQATLPAHTILCPHAHSSGEQVSWPGRGARLGNATEPCFSPSWVCSGRNRKEPISARKAHPRSGGQVGVQTHCPCKVVGQQRPWLPGGQLPEPGQAQSQRVGTSVYTGRWPKGLRERRCSSCGEDRPRAKAQPPPWGAEVLGAQSPGAGPPSPVAPSHSSRAPVPSPPPRVETCPSVCLGLTLFLLATDSYPVRQALSPPAPHPQALWVMNLSFSARGNLLSFELHLQLSL